jgi:hypothetical protein
MTNDTNDTKDQDKRAPGMQRNILKSLCYAAATRLYDTAAVFFNGDTTAFLQNHCRRESPAVQLYSASFAGFIRLPLPA